MSLAKDSTLTSGAQRAVAGPMTKVPWSDLPFIGFTSGSGTSAPGTRTEMQDGGYGVWSLTCGAAGTPNGASLAVVARCSGVAVRARSTGGGGTSSLCMVVDGRIVEAFRASVSRYNSLVTGNWTEYETTFEFPHRLNRVAHTIEALLTPHPDGVTANSYAVSGWSFPRADGFRDSPVVIRKGILGAATALSTTAAAIISGTDYSTATRALRLKNSDTAAHTVTIYREDGTTIYDVISVPIGAGVTAPSVQYTFPQPYNLSGWKWKADVVTVVTGWVEGA